jgi:hypothetical protein
MNKTAILVIHGGDSHNRYQILDDAVRGFSEVYKVKHPNCALRHKLAMATDFGGSSSVQSYVSLSDTDNQVDFYEYYWDVYMTRQPSSRETFETLKRIADSYKKFYVKYPAWAGKAMDQDRGVISGSYINLIAPWFGHFPMGMQKGMYRFFDKRLYGGGASILFSVSFIVLSWIGSHLAWLRQKEVLKDVITYLGSNARTWLEDTRRNMLDGAVNEIEALTNNGGYHRVIILAHSEGSIIAYDALNRIAEKAAAGCPEEANASKIAGFVTCGSPLDKVGILYRVKSDEDRPVQRQINDNNSSFRAKNIGKNASGEILEPPVMNALAQTKWLNFWAHGDYWGGELDLYQTDRNIPTDCKLSLAEGAHSSYWGKHVRNKKGKEGSDTMFIEIIKEFFPSGNSN